MTRSAQPTSLASLLLALVASASTSCDDTPTPGCRENPTVAACVELCMTDPSACEPLDAGTDATTDGDLPDAPGDATPDMTTSACDPACTTPLVCDEDGDVGPAGTCVTCLTDTECSGATPNCVAGACVQCTVATQGTDCDASAPVCDDTTNTCTGCTTGADCDAFDATPICNPDGGACVECARGMDCTGVDAARCDLDTNRCAPCTMDSQCMGTGANVCVMEGEMAGTCVECTADAESACGEFVCDVTTNTCTTTPAGMTGLCGECVSDRQCNDGQLCVPMTFGTDDTFIGNFCLWREDSDEPRAPAGDCTTLRAYVSSEEGTSLGGTLTNVCGLRVTTCPALLGFSMTVCDGPTDDGDAMCGEPGVDDGFCQPFGGGHLCTVGCGGSVDCPSRFACVDSFCSFTPE